MYWLRWHYHVKHIAGAPYKIKKKERKAKQQNRWQSVVAGSLVWIVQHMPVLDKKKRGVLPIAFEIKEFVKMETLLSRVIFKTIMVPLHTWRFQLFYVPLGFPFRG